MPVAAPGGAELLAAAVDRRTAFLAAQQTAASAPCPVGPPVVYVQPPLSQEDDHVPVRCYTATNSYRSDVEHFLSYNRGDTLETMLDGVARRKSAYGSWGIFARITSGEFDGTSGYVRERFLAADN